jgi:molecular chaperone DnaJ
LRYDMEIKLEDAFHGKKAEITVDVSARLRSVQMAPAPSPGTQAKACQTCARPWQGPRQQGFFMVERTCPTCHGAGRDHRRSLHQHAAAKAGSKRPRR